jgi:hypothetical protein
LTFNPLDNGTLVLLEIWASKKNVSLRYLPPPPHRHLLKRLRAGSNTRVFSSFDFIVNRCVYFGQNVLKELLLRLVNVAPELEF